MSEEESVEKKDNNQDMIKKIKKQNPGVKIKRVAGGGFQIVNPRAPSKLLLNLVKRIDKDI